MDDLEDMQPVLGRGQIPVRSPLAATIGELTGDGRDIVKFLISVMKGRVKEAKVSDRMKAAIELLDRGYGKPRPSTAAAPESDEAETASPISVLGGRGVWPMEDGDGR